MGSENLKVVCILPAYNEQGKIGRVVEKVAATGEVDQIVVVDDCSSDGTFEEATAAGAHVIRHKINQGVGAGIRDGLKWGHQNGYGIGVIMAGDDQHEPKELPSVLNPLRRGEADFIQGSRRLKGGGTVNGPLFREITTRLYSAAFTMLTLKRVTDGTNGFRAFFLSLLDDENINLDQTWLNTYELEPYLLWKVVTSSRYRIKEVPITIYYHGESKQYTKMKPFRDWWRLARPLIFLRLGIRS